MKFFSATLFLATLGLALAGRDWSKIKPKGFDVEPKTPASVLARIVGGDEALEHQFPYQAALIINRVHLCGGSIISAKAVLTAAHCVYNATRIEVIVGALNLMNELETSRQTRITTKYQMHDDAAYDVAIVMFPDALNLTDPVKVSTIERYPEPCVDATLVEKQATVSGWGSITDSNDSFSPVLRYAADAVIKNADCNANYGNIQDFHICLNGQNNKGACKGDSGAPLVHYNDTKDETYLVGVMSFGSAWGCEQGYPTVYTRLTCINDWIDGVLANNSARH